MILYKKVVKPVERPYSEPEHPVHQVCRVRAIIKLMDSLERFGFNLRYSDGMAVLTVPPESRRSRPIYADDIAARMKILDIPDVPAKRLRDIIARGSGKPEALVEWPAGAALGATVTVDVDEDGMGARMRVHPPRPGGAPVDEDMIRSVLRNAEVCRGIDEEALTSLLNGAGTDRWVTVARGLAPRKGRPARTECFFASDRGKPWKELSSGRIDLKELNFIQNRQVGDLLARRIKAVDPEDGFDVFGNVLHSEKPEDVPFLEAGDGVRAEGDELFALIDGNVRLEENSIIVEPSVTVKNVDYSTGNIDFDGSVTVEGTVADGFSVSARGDIQVGKTVGRAHLVSGRNLVLVAGMVGDGEGSCTVGENLYGKFLEGAKVQISGDMVITEAVLHTEAEVNGGILAAEGRGEITGGRIVAGQGIDCRRIGNLYAGTTRIHVGCSPEELRGFNTLANQLKGLREETDDLERQIDYLKSRRDSDPREIDIRERARDSRLEKLKDGAGRLRLIRQELTAEPGTEITVRDRVFPGASIHFGLTEYMLGDKGLERAVLRQEKNRVVMHGYVEKPSSG